MNPLIVLFPSLILIGGFGACLYLIALQRQDLRRAIAAWKKDAADAATSRGEILDAIEDSAQRMEETLLRRQSTPQAARKTAIDQTRRNQVIRMAKRGERPEQIAAALGMNASEVTLTLKLQGLIEPHPN